LDTGQDGENLDSEIDGDWDSEPISEQDAYDAYERFIALKGNFFNPDAPEFVTVEFMINAGRKYL